MQSSFVLSLDLPAPLDVGRRKELRVGVATGIIIRLFYPVRISAKTFFGCENCQHAAPFRLSHWERYKNSIIAYSRVNAIADATPDRGLGGNSHESLSSPELLVAISVDEASTGGCNRGSMCSQISRHGCQFAAVQGVQLER